MTIQLLSRNDHGAPTTLPFIQINEVADAAALAGELFLKKFAHPIPKYPRHFVALYAPHPGESATIGYVHYLPFENVFLCGGMCTDVTLYRQMPREHRDAIRAVGSLAEHLLTTTFTMLGDCAAIFGSVGDATARNVDLRAGFIDTGLPHLMVVWRSATEAQKPVLIKKVLALGGF